MDHPAFLWENVMWCGGWAPVGFLYMFFTSGIVTILLPSLIAAILSAIFFVLVILYGALGVVLFSLQLHPFHRQKVQPLPDPEDFSVSHPSS